VKCPPMTRVIIICIDFLNHSTLYLQCWHTSGKKVVREVGETFPFEEPRWTCGAGDGGMKLFIVQRVWRREEGKLADSHEFKEATLQG